MDNPAAARTGPDRFAFVDALRGIAALSVLLLHVAKVPDPPLALPFYINCFVSLGGSGVGLFFILSAFTLSLSMKQRHERSLPVLHFYIRRIFRIVPLFYLLLIVTWFRDFSHFNIIHGWRTVVLNMLFGFNFFPGYNTGIVWASWTLSVEMIFYLFFPLFFRAFNTFWRIGLFLLATVIGAVASFSITKLLIVPVSAFDSFSNTSFFKHLPLFVVGMLTFYIFNQLINSQKYLFRWANYLLSASALLFLTLVIFPYMTYFWTWYMIGPICLCLILSLAIHPLPLIVNPITTFFGKISYSLYLNHPPIVLFLIPLYRWIYGLPLDMHLDMTIKYSACFISTLVVLVPISYVTYRFVELPGIELGRKLIKKL